VSQTPWSRALSREVDDAAIEAGWQRVRTRRSRPRLARAPLAAVAVVAFAALLFFVLRPRDADREVMPVAASALVLPASFTESVTTLEDGSRVEVAPSSELRTTASDAAHVDLALDRGRTTFDIVPGGPRGWRIDAGRVVVRVLGTRFTVDRDEHAVDVRVERGKVSVEGPDVPGGARILTAGDSIHVAEPATPSVTPETLPSAPPPKKAEATAVTEPDLMARADAARREGHPRDAVALLIKVVAKKGPQAPLAAFTLAKIEADDLGDAASAATWFERAASLGLPSGLDEEALARAVESSAKAGRRADATRLAHRYEAKFPNGRHLERVRSWSSP
jgi:transmembrane sensor